MEQPALKRMTKVELERKLRFGGWFDSATGATCLCHDVHGCQRCTAQVQKHLDEYEE